jgi:hypothetical protein
VTVAMDWAVSLPFARASVNPRRGRPTAPAREWWRIEREWRALS